MRPLYESVKEEKSEADKMFEELGYKKIYSDAIRYKKQFELKGARHIIFAIDKTICICEENENGLAVKRDYFNMQELKAINQKCKEMRVVR